MSVRRRVGVRVFDEGVEQRGGCGVTDRGRQQDVGEGGGVEVEGNPLGRSHPILDLLRVKGRARLEKEIVGGGGRWREMIDQVHLLGVDLMT